LHSFTFIPKVPVVSAATLPMTSCYSVLYEGKKNEACLLADGKRVFKQVYYCKSFPKGSQKWLDWRLGLRKLILQSEIHV
jgi:hypothetical protein